MQLLHTMLRVGDLQRSIDFLHEDDRHGAAAHRRRAPSRSTPSAFVAFRGGNRNGEAELELTYNHGVSDYDLGTAYGHIALGVENVAEDVRADPRRGRQRHARTRPVKGGSTVIAFVKDPDGYMVELIETASREI